MDWNDPNTINEFKVRAKGRGHSDADIQQYIMEKQATTSLDTIGNLLPETPAITPMTYAQPDATPSAALNPVEMKPQVPQEAPVVAQPVVPGGGPRITQNFGNPNSRLYGRSRSGAANINRGLDVAAKPGEVQAAPPEGKWVVQEARTGNKWNTGWGNTVVIKNVDTGETIRRSHLKDVLVKPGQEVTGKPLGTTGRTGRTTGYHKDIEYTTPQGKLSDYSKSKYFQYER